MTVAATVLRFPPRLRRVDLDALNRQAREEAPIATVTVRPPIQLDEHRRAPVHESFDDDPNPPAPAMALVA